MLGRGPLGALPMLLNFDAWNRAIWLISIQGCAGSDMLDSSRGWLIGVVDKVDRTDKGPCRLRLGTK